MMGQTLSWEDGKEVMKSTTNTLFLITPVKYNIPVPGASPWLQKTINWGAGAGTKTGIKHGVYYWLDNW